MIGEGVERMRFADPQMQDPHPENHKARYPTASLKWIFYIPQPDFGEPAAIVR